MSVLVLYDLTQREKYHFPRSEHICKTRNLPYVLCRERIVLVKVHFRKYMQHMRNTGMINHVLLKMPAVMKVNMHQNMQSMENDGTSLE